MRIGLTGYAKSGKDEVADVLATEYGFVKVNMSDAINNYLCILDPIAGRIAGMPPEEAKAAFLGAWYLVRPSSFG